MLLPQYADLLLLSLGQIYAAKGEPRATAAADARARLIPAAPASAWSRVLRECAAGSEGDHDDECAYTKTIHLGYLRPVMGLLIHWTIRHVAAVGRRCDNSMAGLG
jgi:hypothetical protein